MLGPNVVSLPPRTSLGVGGGGGRSYGVAQLASPFFSRVRCGKMVESAQEMMFVLFFFLEGQRWHILFWKGAIDRSFSGQLVIKRWTTWTPWDHQEAGGLLALGTNAEACSGPHPHDDRRRPRQLDAHRCEHSACGPAQRLPGEGSGWLWPTHF